MDLEPEPHAADLVDGRERDAAVAPEAPERQRREARAARRVPEGREARAREPRALVRVEPLECAEPAGEDRDEARVMIWA